MSSDFMGGSHGGNSDCQDHRPYIHRRTQYSPHMHCTILPYCHAFKTEAFRKLHSQLISSLIDVVGLCLGCEHMQRKKPTNGYTQRVQSDLWRKSCRNGTFGCLKRLFYCRLSLVCRHSSLLDFHWCIPNSWELLLKRYKDSSSGHRAVVPAVSS